MRNIMFGGMLVAGAALGYMYYKKNTKWILFNDLI
jgi:hypothetical protein